MSGRELSAQSGFTLFELLLVLLLLGVAMGLGLYGVDRMDPGSRGLQAALPSFITASRDRARSTGRSVAVTLRPPTMEEPARVVRHTWRRRLEGTFEESAKGEGVVLAAPAVLGTAGRCGGCLDMEEGGGATLEGRGGQIRTASGMSVEFDFRDTSGDGGVLFTWENLLKLSRSRDGGIQVELRAGDGDLFTQVREKTTGGLTEPARWHHLRVDIFEGQLLVYVDGLGAYQTTVPPVLAVPEGHPFLGDPSGDFHGSMDEVSLWVRVTELGPELRDDILAVWDGIPDPGGEIQPILIFQRDGLLDPSVHPEAIEMTIVEYGEEVGSFVIGRFTEEAVL